MSEPTSSPNEPTTSPVATNVAQPTDVERDPEPRRSRVTAVAAWVGIAAGVVFIVAVVFFSGFILGAHSGGHRGSHHGGGDRDLAIIHRGGPPPMFPGPRGEFERPPGFGPSRPGGPSVQPPQPPQAPGAPSTTAPARP
jgi:hypothetical protein